MLSSPDAAVARRDPAVPGLAVLLDEAAVAGWLATALPGARVEEVRARYVRYKARTSCLVGYDLVVDGRPVRGYGKAHRAGDTAKATKPLTWAREPGPAGPGAVVRAAEALAFVFAPNDRRLRRLADLGPDGAIRRRLTADRPSLRGADLTWLVHKPERRAVGRLDVDGVPAAVVRCHTGRVHARALAGARAAAAAGVASPAVLGTHARSGSLLVSWCPGVPLDLDVDGVDGHVASTGAAVARLHRRPPDGLLPAGPDEAALVAAGAAVATVAPALGERARRLARRLAAASGPGRSATVHGDLSADQVVLDGDRVALLDLDAAGAGDPVDDLGRFLATADAAVVAGRLAPGRRDAVVRALVDGYAAESGRPVDEARLRRARSTALLLLAVEPFRVREPDWPRQVAALVARAEALATALPAVGWAVTA